MFQTLSPLLFKAAFLTKLLDTLQSFAMTSGLRLIAALLVLIIGTKLASLLSKSYLKSAFYKKTVADVQGILRWSINFILHALVVILAIAILGIPLTSVATIISSAAVALGLALQGSLANLAGGLMLLVFKPFHVGDCIEASGFSGVVENIGVFYTSLKTFDNCRVVMPNASLSNTNLTNYSVFDTRRVDMTISAGASCDSEQIKQLIRETIRNETLALSDPAPFVRLDNCTDGKMNFTVRVWCKSPDYFDLYNDLQEHIQKSLADNGISPAVPSVKVVK